MASTDTKEAVEVPKKVYHQLTILRATGKVNMFTDVLFGLRELGFEEAAEWVEDNPETYVRGFHHGFEPRE
ncbi:MAG: hypothetical protein ABEH58_06165 [Haloplanus sp.]